MGIDSARLADYLRDIRQTFQPTNGVLLEHLDSNFAPLRHQLRRYTAIQNNFVTKVCYELLPTMTNNSPKVVSVAPYLS